MTTPTEYWTKHLVANRKHTTREASLDHFHWRNAQYPGYIELMPVTGQNDKVVLDYGCGPGNDLVGFGEFSKTKKLYGVDISSSALRLAEERLALHDIEAELIQIDDSENELPISSLSVDYIHTSGVLHHCTHLNAALSEFHRILKPGGKLSIMVYNHDSLWLHLYVAYVLRIEQGKYQDGSLMDAFRRSTDGSECPISHCYKKEDFIKLVKSFGFSGGLSGCSISKHELSLLHKRNAAVNCKELDSIHTSFLNEITLNQNGIPFYGKDVAGIGSCYHFSK